jgi:hypothetical protein
MPFFAVALKFKAAYSAIRKQAAMALRKELDARAQEVLDEARASIVKGGGSSSPGHPFHSQRGATKRLLKKRVGRRTAFVGFGRGKATVDKRTGKKIRPARAVPNILEHGSRRMAPRPVLEPALERVKDHPFRSML